MRSDHTATELATPQPPLASPLDDAGESVSHREIRALARVTFCFAWLFGLEPFLTGTADDVPRSKSCHH
ncbi:hypothetical protein FVF58_13955 [Paraburkholderia panacisoli]|uniref:Uncharacterized protein n=1 Tax=Paraburkholderia panacisoli TaxID=2603818 RepID=A0A5B0H8R8_9BURK|nr:hypothetical protein [Paraburkholderia panacisoli]KAA1011598.1 hypothetical protein FVF58_13955 [Paraburkholderia panacisoli]